MDIAGRLLQHKQGIAQPALAFIDEVGVGIQAKHVACLTHGMRLFFGQADDGLDGAICGQCPVRIAARAWLNGEHAVGLSLAAGLGVDATMGVVSVGEAQVRVAIAPRLGLDVLNLPACWCQGAFAIDAQAVLILIQIGFDCALDWYECLTVEIGHGSAWVGSDECDKRRGGQCAVLQLHHSQFTPPALRVARKRQVVRSLSWNW